MLNIFEKLFLKKRFVLVLYNNIIITDHKYDYSVVALDKRTASNNELVISTNILKINKNFINKLYKKDWTLFIIKDEKNNELAGYYFSIHGRYIHDNFFLDYNKALLCNAFVYPKHRKKGLYKSLIKIAHQYLFQKGFNEVFTIVEKNNKSSLNANLSIGLKIFYVNYLIKFFGVNVFSLYYKNSKLKLVLTGRLFFNIIIYKDKDNE